jgi:hypothetical protein
MEPEGGGILTVYIFYNNNCGYGCITGAAFRLASGGGFTGTYIGETWHSGFALIGNIHDGVNAVSIDTYDPGLLASVQYMTDGMSPPCSWLKVVGWPEYDDDIMVYRCDDQFLAAGTHGVLSINVSYEDRYTCDPIPWCAPVATHETTWGQIKSLYR